MCIITTTPIQHLFFQVKIHPPQIQFSLTYLGDNPEYPQPASISGSNIVFANGSEYYLGIKDLVHNIIDANVQNISNWGLIHNFLNDMTYNPDEGDRGFSEEKQKTPFCHT